MTLRTLFHRDESRYTIPQLLRWLWQAWRGNRRQACLNALIGLAGVGCSLASVWAIQRAIDTASGVRHGSVYGAVGVMAGIIVMEFALGISRVWVKNILGIRAQNRMQQDMLARLLRSEWRGREAMHSGDVINRLEQDVRHVVDFLTETLPSTLSTIALFIGAFCYLLNMDVWLAVVTVAILPVFLLLSRFYVSRIRRYTRSIRQSDSQVQSLLTETMQHRMLVKTMEADSQILDRLDDTQSTLRQKVRQRTAFSVASNLMLNTGFSLGYLVAFLWGALRLQAGTLSFGGMTAFLQLVYRIQGPARSLAKLVPAFVGVFTAAERLMELEETPEEEQGAPVMLSGPCGICFDRVTFAYSDAPAGTATGADVPLRSFSARFAPGTCTAILGETGAGKTTLIRLMLALVRPAKGTISIYNASGHSSTLSPLHRCNFVYVPQGNTLLSGTLRDNLLLGNSAVSDDEMRRALHLACADFALQLPQGLDTSLAEQGGGLSEGQAQRIAIARALLRPGSIMLLDEATSALDEQTERQLLANLLEGQQRTVICVTHRTAVVDYCDHVVRLGQE